LRKRKSYEERGFCSKNNLTECICPKCGGEHKVRIYWAGRGRPKIFCIDCKNELGIDYKSFELDEHKVSPGILQSL